MRTSPERRGAPPPSFPKRQQVTADPSKTSDFSPLDTSEESHVTKRNWITINANYELVIDNLLDLSHVSYLHDGLLGNEDTIDSKISVEQEGDTVISGRWPTSSLTSRSGRGFP